MDLIDMMDHLRLIHRIEAESGDSNGHLASGVDGNPYSTTRVEDADGHAAG